MKIKALQETRRLTTLAGAVAIALASVSVSNATVINQSFTATTGCEVTECGTSGGIITFTDYSELGSGLAANQLKITFDNTTIASDVGDGFLNSSLITGLVFNIEADITAATVASFVDGAGAAITGWIFGIDVNNETTPNNTVFDIGFETTNGANGGLYNFAGPGDNTDNAKRDIAVLILTITDPDPWTFTEVGDDSVLRMQRVGTGGDGSLKIVTSTSSSTTSGGATTSSTGSTSGGASTGSSGNVPEPGMISLLGIGLLGQALLLRQRRRRLQK